MLEIGGKMNEKEVHKEIKTTKNTRKKFEFNLDQSVNQQSNGIDL